MGSSFYEALITWKQLVTNLYQLVLLTFEVDDALVTAAVILQPLGSFANMCFGGVFLLQESFGHGDLVTHVRRFVFTRDTWFDREWKWAVVGASHDRR